MASSTPKVSLKLGTASKKIDSPIAKYNSAGQLTCIVCNTIIKSEIVWTAHVNGRQHREQVIALKKPNAEPQFAKPAAVSAVKRKGDSMPSANAPSPSKKTIPDDFFDKKASAVSAPKPIKSILKNSSNTLSIQRAVAKEAPAPPSHQSTVEEAPNQNDDMEVDESPSSTATNKSSEVVEAPLAPNTVPEGFFDDPKLDAKVRHIEYKDPVEEEWAKFQKEINEEVTASVAIQEEDQEESTAERQLEEIEEQMMKWGRVLEMEQKKELYIQRLRATRESMQTDQAESSSDEDESEMDKFFDWRSKAT